MPEKENDISNKSNQSSFKEKDDKLVVKNNKNLDLIIDLKLKNNNKIIVNVNQSINFPSILEPALIGGATDQIDQALQLLGITPFKQLLKKYIMDLIDDMHKPEKAFETSSGEQKTLVTLIDEISDLDSNNNLPSQGEIDLEVESENSDNSNSTAAANSQEVENTRIEQDLINKTEQLIPKTYISNHKDPIKYINM